MKNVPKNLKYSKSHEWVKVDDDNIVTVGISEHAASLLGDLVYVELPTVGQEYTAGDECCVVESVKAAADVYCPLSGTIAEVNSNLENSPEEINNEPYNTGWIFKIKVNKISEIESLISADDYTSLTLEEA